MADGLENVGVVVIGRNEGERLSLCLRSVAACLPRVTYSDSGSTDPSVARAKELGVRTVELDASASFTAARGRNAGLATMSEVFPDIEFVQFVDGDTAIAPGWLERAASELGADPKLGVVCGRLFEKNRESNVIRRVFGLEWDGPIGKIDACGGIAMMRLDAVRRAGGYNAALVAGEEADLCNRIRTLGFAVRRVDCPMGEHDSGIDSIRPWWTRAVRVGHAYAKAVKERGGDGDPRLRRQVLSAALWGGALPVLMLASAVVTWWLPWVGLMVGVVAALYSALMLKIYVRTRRSGRGIKDARWYAVFCVLAKLPQMQGIVRYAVRG